MVLVGAAAASRPASGRRGCACRPASARRRSFWPRRSAPGAGGPPRGFLDRGPRRRPGRRDTPALEPPGDTRGRGRSVRSHGCRLRAHAAGAEAARPGRDAPGRGDAHASAPRPRARPLRRPGGASRSGSSGARRARTKGTSTPGSRRPRAARGVPVRALEAGDVWEREGARLSVLHSGGPARKADAVNNQSIVALFERDGRARAADGRRRRAGRGRAARGRVAAAGRRAQGRPPRQPHVDHRGLRRRDPAARRAALLRAAQPVRTSRGRQTLATLSRFCVPVVRTDERSDARVELLPAATRLAWRGLEGP